jgi:hypothetical protein
LQSKIETQLTMPIRIVDREYPIDKVREAIKSGHNTLRLMVAKTKLPTDQVTDLIADLLLWKREIKSATVGETRIYFFVEEKPAPIVQRKPMVCAGSGFTKKEQPMRRWAVG